jgi:hypothetical protein
MKNKTVILMAGLIIILILILLFQQIIQKAAPSQQSSINKTGQIKILSTNIGDTPVGVVDSIVIKLNQPIPNQHPNIQLNPPLPFQISVDQSYTELSINPAEAWSFDSEYSIILPRNMFGETSLLDRDYEFRFTTEKYNGI